MTQITQIALRSSATSAVKIDSTAEDAEERRGLKLRNKPRTKDRLDITFSLDEAATDDYSQHQKARPQNTKPKLV